MVQVTPAPEEPGFTLSDWIPAAPSVAVALFAIWAVHKLTRVREREKSVFELYRSLGEHAAATATAAAAAWATPNGPERRRAVAETKWRLQQLGGLAERLRALSRRKRKGRWWFPWPRKVTEISLRAEMFALRRDLTSDPFEEPDRKADKDQAETIEQAMGTFLTAADQHLADWMD